MRPAPAAFVASSLLLAACSFDASPTGAASGSLEAGIDPVLGRSMDAASDADGASSPPGDASVILPDGAVVHEPPDASPTPPPDSGPALDATIAQPEAGVDATIPDVPVTSQAHPGDYPGDPYGEVYLPVPGFFAPGGAPRGYKLHVPPGFSEDATSPVLFALHGEGSTGVTFAAYGAELIGLADDLGLVLVVPNGIQSGGGALGSWNGGACCGPAAVAAVDDVAFVRAVLADVRTRLKVDFSRTYALGFSGGAFLAYRLGCEAAEIFSAVISAGGGIGTPDLSAVSGLGNSGFSKCSPTRPVSVFHVHGSVDSYVPFDAMNHAVAFWSHANGCGDVPSITNPPLGTGASSCVSYAGCRESTRITACTVVDGGHCWFGSASCGSGNAPNLAQNIGRNSDDFVTTSAVATFLGQLHPRP